ncbi:acylphosphatase [Candidatus Desantisbacteria bacterium CG07_land_8_20_14_0_80_39_15]|uniref:Acylphosphatase n=1 Tax=Candidatus Desantisbacteria bacterium CG07_land_8_20_14_0_80_39_15 TaxID=1974549 RepID=A0A2M6ZGT1_9BACT|nr:MAG: acylphosphatase [Candidatus Desantisbacteria bacterium CG07_land_8_20_14_0_80_39_15]
MRRAHLYISGRVQGVCFRAETCDEADRLGVKGWVRNLPGGSVEAVAEGEDSAIEEFVKYCHKGPSGAYVRKVEISEENFKNEFKDFYIRF